MYALLEYKGKQYKVEKGKEIVVDKLSEEEGAKITIDSVLLLSEDGKVSVGTPYVQNAKVTATVGRSFKDKKVIVYKHKSKKDYHKTIGHRQTYTYLTIEDILR